MVLMKILVRKEDIKREFLSRQTPQKYYLSDI